MNHNPNMIANAEEKQQKKPLSQIILYMNFFLKRWDLSISDYSTANVQEQPYQKVLGVLVKKRLDMTQHMHLQPRMPNKSWAASKALWAAGQGRGFSLLHSYETPPWALLPALGSSAQERHGTIGARPEEEHWHGQWAWTSLLRESWECWSCSAWRRECSTDHWGLSEIRRKMGTNFGQEIMSLNWRRVN